MHRLWSSFALVVPLQSGEPLRAPSLVRDSTTLAALSEWPRDALRSRRATCTTTEAAGDPRSTPDEAQFLSVHGPGVLLRAASDAPSGRWRVYVDGAREPLVDLEAGQFFTALSARPVSAPIVFVESCRVTAKGAASQRATFDWQAFASAELVRATDATAWSQARSTTPTAVRVPSRELPFELVLSPHDGRDAARALVLEWSAPADDTLVGRGQAIDTLSFELESESGAALDADSTFARGTAIALAFDGRETLRMPLDEFLALSATTEPGAVTHSCRTWMPYRHRARLEMRAYGSERVAVRGRVRLSPADWSERTLYLHGRWRSAGASSSAIELAGRGRIAALTCQDAGADGGTELQLVLDGESLAQRLTTVGAGRASERFAIDAPLFSESARIAPAQRTPELALLYYAPSAASDDVGAFDEAMRAAVMPQSVALPGALECESMKVLASTPGLGCGTQALAPNESGRWSNGEQLFVRATAVGQFVELELPVTRSGARELVLYATRSWDYGTIQCSLGGVRLGAPVATFHAEAQTRIGAPRAQSLGTVELQPPRAVLRIEVVGTDPRSRPPHYYFGLDCIVLKEPR